MKLQNSFRGYSVESVLSVRQALAAFLGVLLLTDVLIVNLHNLRIARFTDYQTRSNENRTKLVPIAPSRSIIYDHNGIPLTLSRTIYQIEMMPEKIDNVQDTLDAPCNVVSLTDDDITVSRKERARSHCSTSVPVETDPSEVQVARFAVNQYRFLGVEARGHKRRYYSYDSALTHVIGYVSKIDDKDVGHLGRDGKLTSYAAAHDIGKLGIERYYEDVFHGQADCEEAGVNSRGHVTHQLKEVVPQAGHDIYLTLDLKLQQYIETLSAGSCATVVVIDPRTGGVFALVSMSSYDPNLFVDGISSKDYSGLFNDPNTPLVNRTTQGICPPASTVKPYAAASALSAGVITRNTGLFDPGWWQLPGSEKRCRDWKKWGRGHLNITRSLKEWADTFFYRITCDMGIDRLLEQISKFGYGQYTGTDLAEECAGNVPTREWKQKRFKRPWYQGDAIPVDIGQDYWTATPIQMSKALMILINDSLVEVLHLLVGTAENDKQVPWIQPYEPLVGDIHSGYWEIAKDGMCSVADRPNGTAYKYFAGAPYKIAAKSGIAQVFGLKIDETYNAHKIAERSCDHKLMMVFTPYDKSQIVVAIILENGDAGPVVGTTMRWAPDYIMLGDNNTNLPAENPTVAAAED